MNIIQLAHLRHKESYLPRPKYITWSWMWPKLTHLSNFVIGVATHELDALAFAHGTFHNADINNNTFIRVEMAVVDKCLKRGIGLPSWGRNAINNGSHDLIHSQTSLGANSKYFFGLNTKHGFHLSNNIIRPGYRHIDFI